MTLVTENYHFVFLFLWEMNGRGRRVIDVKILVRYTTCHVHTTNYVKTQYSPNQPLSADCGPFEGPLTETTENCESDSNLVSQIHYRTSWIFFKQIQQQIETCASVAVFNTPPFHTRYKHWTANPRKNENPQFRVHLIEIVNFCVYLFSNGGIKNSSKKQKLKMSRFSNFCAWKMYITYSLWIPMNSDSIARITYGRDSGK